MFDFCCFFFLWDCLALVFILTKEAVGLLVLEVGFRVPVLGRGLHWLP